MAASWCASTYGQATSERLARINGVAWVIEFDVDESGKITAKSWEWKEAAPPVT
jgi:hypothetical protein